MKRNLKVCSLLLFAVFIGVVACKHQPMLPTPAINTNDTANNSDNNQDTTTTVDTGICFERDILPIFLSQCAKSGCHDAASHEDGYVLDSYNSIMASSYDDDGIVPGNANESKIYRSLIDNDDDDRMPLAPNPPLSATQINLIKRWINEGAQNGANCVVLCDTANTGYNAAIKPIMENNCTGCHNASLASGGIILSTYAGVAAAATDGSLLGSIRHQSGYVAMPQGGTKLSDCKIKQVEKWIQAGSQNN